MATTEEIQELINTKNWKKLNLVIPSMFEVFRNGTEFTEYTYNMEFFIEFLFSLNWNFNGTDAHGVTIDFKTVGKNALLYAAAFNLTEQGYKEFLMGLVGFLSEGKKTLYFKYILAESSKYLGVNFYKAILNSPIRKLFENEKFKATFCFENIYIDNLVGLDRDQLMEVISFSARSHNILNLENILDFFSSTEQFIDYYSFELNKNSSFFGVSLGVALSKLSESEYLKALKYVKEEKVFNTFPVRVYEYYDYNDLEIPQSVIYDLINYNRLGGYINKLTDQQIEDNAKELSLPSLLGAGISLDKVMDLKSDMYANGDLSDISRMGFFTEEEILKYPFLFSPRNMLYGKGSYLTRETFKILNKTWGIRQRYKEELTDFTYLFGQLDGKDVNLKNLKYLKMKTGASNSVVANKLDSAEYKFNASKVIEPILILKRLKDKYENN